MPHLRVVEEDERRARVVACYAAGGQRADEGEDENARRPGLLVDAERARHRRRRQRGGCDAVEEREKWNELCADGGAEETAQRLRAKLRARGLLLRVAARCHRAQLIEPLRADSPPRSEGFIVVRAAAAASDAHSSERFEDGDAG